MSMRTGSGRGLWITGVVALVAVWVAFRVWPSLMLFMVAALATILIPVILIVDMMARGGPGPLWATIVGSTIAARHDLPTDGPRASDDDTFGSFRRPARLIRKHGQAAAMREELEAKAVEVSARRASRGDETPSFDT